MGDVPARSSGGKKARNVFISGLNAAVEIVSVLDFFDEDFQDGQSVLDLKEQELNGDKIRIRYRVVGQVQNVSLQIDYVPTDVHDRFYAQYTNSNFKPPTVVRFFKDERREPGEYVVEWDGRDQTVDARLLLSGQYQIKIKGVTFELVLRTASTDIQVAKPVASNFGMHYRKKGDIESTKKETNHANSQQSKLADGSGYSSSAYLDYSARNAMDAMQKSAVVYWSGHSGPGGINFYDKEGGKYSRKHKSTLKVYHRNVKEPDASLRDEHRDSFKDLFLIMMNGCRPANEISMFQAVLNLFFPGRADGKSGTKTVYALGGFQAMHGLTPSDGLMNDATLAWFGISTDQMSERAQLREIQKHLRRYRAGKPTGKLNSRTRRALRAYQGDHPDLNVTGQPDEPTRVSLKLGVQEFTDEGKLRFYLPRNIAEGMGYNGADITMGFEHKIDFDIAEDWAIKFWDHLASGQGVNTAASNATALVDHRRRRQCSYNIYLQDGVSQEAKLQPARYGKT